MYGVSPNGWMDTDIFFEWFKRFAEQVQERPLLLIYDGHLSHVSIKLIEEAMKEDITLLKLPPHVTDMLQPLDVCGFGPLKREKLLNERINILGPREPISKPVFVDLLAKVWHKGLMPENVRAAFRTTGIWPVDSQKYNVDRFDQRLLRRYNYWVELGRPDDLYDEFVSAVQTPKKTVPVPSELPSNILPVASASNTPTLPGASSSNTPTLPGASSSNTGILPDVASCTSSIPGPSSSTPSLGNVSVTGCENCRMLGPKPNLIIPGKVLVPVCVWTLQDEQNKSFEELILDKMKGPQPKTEQSTRRKIDLKTKVITDPQYLKALKEKEKKNVKTKNTITAGKKKKIIEKKVDTSDDDSEE